MCSRIGAFSVASPHAEACNAQRGDNIVAIPGTTKLANLKQNLGAANVKLTPAAIAKLDSLAAKVKGERYDEAGLKGVNG